MVFPVETWRELWICSAFLIFHIKARHDRSDENAKQQLMWESPKKNTKYGENDDSECETRFICEAPFVQEVLYNKESSCKSYVYSFL